MTSVVFWQNWVTSVVFWQNLVTCCLLTALVIYTKVFVKTVSTSFLIKLVWIWQKHLGWFWAGNYTDLFGGGGGFIVTSKMTIFFLHLPNRHKNLNFTIVLIYVRSSVKGCATLNTFSYIHVSFISNHFINCFSAHQWILQRKLKTPMTRNRQIGMKGKSKFSCKVSTKWKLDWIKHEHAFFFFFYNSLILFFKDTRSWCRETEWLVRPTECTHWYWIFSETKTMV